MNKSNSTPSDPGVLDLYITLKCQSLAAQQNEESCEGLKETMKVEECCDMVGGIPKVKKYNEVTSICNWIQPPPKKDRKGNVVSTNLGYCVKDKDVQGSSLISPNDEYLYKKVLQGIAEGKTKWLPE